MQFQILGNPDYGELTVGLAAGDSVLCESGAMSRMSAQLDLKSRVIGGVLAGLGRKMLGGESFFLGEYSGPHGGWLTLSPSRPGCVEHYRMDGHEEFVLTAGAFLACSPGITIKTRFGGMRAFFSGEGAFLLRCSGSGDLFFNCYGALVQKEIENGLIVDGGHVVAFEPSLQYRIRGMGGVKQTLFSGEGLVMEFSGRGRIWLQTRHLRETAGWLAPYCA